MPREATRRAIEWPRMIGGLTCITLGVLYFRVADGDLGFYLILFGLVVGGIALLGRGCGVCGKTLTYREFGYLPDHAGTVVGVVDSHNVDRVIDLISEGPRIGDLDKPRTALMVYSCSRCKQIAELTVGDLGHGFRTLTAQIYNTPDVARLHEAVRHTPKKR